MRPWLEIFLKVVIRAAIMCSGLVVAKYDGPVVGDEGHKGGRGMKQDQWGLDRAA